MATVAQQYRTYRNSLPKARDLPSLPRPLMNLAQASVPAWLDDRYRTGIQLYHRAQGMAVLLIRASFAGGTLRHSWRDPRDSAWRASYEAVVAAKLFTQTSPLGDDSDHYTLTALGHEMIDLLKRSQLMPQVKPQDHIQVKGQPGTVIEVSLSSASVLFEGAQHPVWTPLEDIQAPETVQSLHNSPAESASEGHPEAEVEPEEAPDETDGAEADAGTPTDEAAAADPRSPEQAAAEDKPADKTPDISEDKIPDTTPDKDAAPGDVRVVADDIPQVFLDLARAQWPKMEDAEFVRKQAIAMMGLLVEAQLRTARSASGWYYPGRTMLIGYTDPLVKAGYLDEAEGPLHVPKYWYRITAAGSALLGETWPETADPVSGALFSYAALFVAHPSKPEIDVYARRVQAALIRHKDWAFPEDDSQQICRDLTSRDYMERQPSPGNRGPQYKTTELGAGLLDHDTLYFHLLDDDEAEAGAEPLDYDDPSDNWVRPPFDIEDAPGASDDAPVAAEDEDIFDQAAAVVNAASKVEVKTLKQVMDEPEKMARADEELAEHLTCGWEILNLTILGPMMDHRLKMFRVVTMQRKPRPEDRPQPAQRRRMIEPVGEQLVFVPGAPNTPGPWAQAIRTHGLGAVLDQADQVVVETARQAYTDATPPAGAASTVHLIPDKAVDHD